MASPTIIIGGGIIGLSTAYYLTELDPKSGQSITVIDSAPSLLLSASGYAAGFLALDWFSPQVTSLGALSFKLHRQLADKHDGSRKWGYAASTAYSLAVEEVGVGGRKTGKKVRGEDWLLEGTSRAGVAKKTDAEGGLGSGSGGAGDAGRNEMLNEDGSPAWMTKQEGGTLETISDHDGCAQVEPRELCEWLIETCKERGVQFQLDCHVQELIKDDHDTIKGLKVKKSGSDQVTNVEGRNILLAAGAWTSKLYQKLFPQGKSRFTIGPLAGYSIVVRSPRYSRPIVDPSRHGVDAVTGMCHSVFCAPGPRWTYAPEAFSRMTKQGKPEVYVAGLNDTSFQLPENVAQVKTMMDPAKLKELRRTTVLLTGLSKEGDTLVEDDLEVVREALCMRPVSNTNRPVIGKLKDGATRDGGVYVASGHGPWGISLAPATGLVMAELMHGKTTSADISYLEPE